MKPSASNRLPIPIVYAQNCAANNLINLILPLLYHVLRNVWMKMAIYIPCRFWILRIRFRFSGSGEDGVWPVVCNVIQLRMSRRRWNSFWLPEISVVKRNLLMRFWKIIISENYAKKWGWKMEYCMWEVQLNRMRGILEFWIRVDSLKLEDKTEDIKWAWKWDFMFISSLAKIICW